MHRMSHRVQFLLFPPFLHGGNGTTMAVYVMMALCAVGVSAFYIPGALPTEYSKGDTVPIYVNQLDSVQTQLPLDYYSLPFCRPDAIESIPETLGQVLMGERTETSAYKATMLEDMPCSVLCRHVMTPDEQKHLATVAREGYTVHMQADGLPSLMKHSMTTDDGSVPVVVNGFPLAVKSANLADPNYYLFNHVTFRLKYHQVGSKYRVVGFDVSPMSIKHEYRGEWTSSTKPTTCANPGLHAALSLGSDNREVVWTYAVEWIASSTPWASRWDAYLDTGSTRVHWFAIANSLILCLFLSGIVAMVLLRTLYRDLATYSANLEEAQEEDAGWKLVHGDVFRAPRFAPFLVVLAGSGVQVAGMAVITLTFAMLGFLSPANRGSLVNAILIMYAAMGFPAGFVASSLARALALPNQAAIVLATAVLFPATAGTVILVLNAVLHFAGYASVPVIDLMYLAVLWAGIGAPLVYAGSRVARQRPAPSFPIRVNQIPRQIPTLSWTNHPLIAIGMGGMLPIGVIALELSYVMSSLWKHHVYTLFGFLLSVFLILELTCVQVAIVLVYFQLCAEDYRWWWRSFLAPGTSGIWLFGYAVSYYMTRLDIQSPVSATLYFGYMLLLSAFFFILTGATGFFAALAFTRKIYSIVKIE